MPWLYTEQAQTITEPKIPQVNETLPVPIAVRVNNFLIYYEAKPDFLLLCNLLSYFISLFLGYDL